MIRFDSVSFAHPNGVVALRDITLGIGAGELVAVVGENGAGKTTLIRHLNGLLKPTRGTVTIHGEDTRHASVAQLSRRVGIVFQNPDHQLFSESVEREILFALRNFGLSSAGLQRRVDWALGFFGLEEYRDSSPMLLSGGEKKRLCLAAVLAWNPDIVVLDEPTVGQDAAQKERLGQIVQGLVSQERIVILVSHDIEFLWPLQPRTIVMTGGRILLDGPASVVFRTRDVLRTARVRVPQLLDFADAVGLDQAQSCATVYDVREHLLAFLRERVS